MLKARGWVVLKARGWVVLKARYGEVVLKARYGEVVLKARYGGVVAKARYGGVVAKARYGGVVAKARASRDVIGQALFGASFSSENRYTLFRKHARAITPLETGKAPKRAVRPVLKIVKLVLNMVEVRRRHHAS